MEPPMCNAATHVTRECCVSYVLTGIMQTSKASIRAKLLLPQSKKCI
jgi:hypothetical protein